MRSAKTNLEAESNGRPIGQRSRTEQRHLLRRECNQLSVLGARDGGQRSDGVKHSLHPLEKRRMRAHPEFMGFVGMFIGARESGLRLLGDPLVTQQARRVIGVGSGADSRAKIHQLRQHGDADPGSDQQWASIQVSLHHLVVELLHPILTSYGETAYPCYGLGPLLGVCLFCKEREH